jgi:hypothetical protein
MERRPMKYILEFTEKATYHCEVIANSKAEAIAKVKAADFDIMDMYCGGMPYAVKVIGVVEQEVDA